ncbi:hypothetical protein Pmar_PMAR009156 [Perkinsus marinus ATCC 50983]|uniref:Uncharacterized protein n=1 Tax=Perkinsus marinus (strain ATCC 50983 / TXsc) TaxID=423536 RepID=C5KBK9_PERM5|nr:hypothetical protein Pmar_PMAR009156 [Perkinsus marinus ATCC 50983]EER18129.1 hypothetical protein Pmar_PMAR009156 [Perkinsus marinus ATCC 50983]|eukprot:XP_002786333.1 hypothetical protein Pmar_PMAR009156 [Perkinsus marinus ATCC 50983]
MGNKRGERRKRMNARQKEEHEATRAELQRLQGEISRDGKKLEDGIQAEQSTGTAVCVQVLELCDYTSKELEKTRCNLIQALNAHKSELQARQQAEDDAEVQKQAARVADERAMQLEERIQARDGEVFTFKLDL